MRTSGGTSRQVPPEVWKSGRKARWAIRSEASSGWGCRGLFGHREHDQSGQCGHLGALLDRSRRKCGNRAARLGGRSDLKRQAVGDVAAYLGIVNTINLGNADIWGHFSTGPAGSVEIGPQGSVGDQI